MWAVCILDEKCESTVNRTVMWTHIQFDAKKKFPHAALCHFQCILLLRKWDHGTIILCSGIDKIRHDVSQVSKWRKKLGETD